MLSILSIARSNMLLALTPERSTGFLPLDHDAALRDGRSVVLVGADESINWWCAPVMDALPLFNRLHNPEGGRFRSVAPESVADVHSISGIGTLPVTCVVEPANADPYSQLITLYLAETSEHPDTSRAPPVLLPRSTSLCCWQTTPLRILIHSYMYRAADGNRSSWSTLTNSIRTTVI